jgi:hypothetical protein
LGGDTLGLSPGAGEEIRRSFVSAAPVERAERLVDGGPYERVNKRERLLRPQHVDPHERFHRLGGGLLVQAGQFGGLAGIGVVAENGNSLRQSGRLGLKP